MKNCNFKQNNKPQQNLSPRIKAVPFVAEISVPTEMDFVKIPVTEYTGLVANNALLEAVKRVIAHDPYSNYTILRTMLGMNEKEDK